MKNPYCKIENEIRNWLESKDYSVNYSYCVESIFFVLPQKISDINLNEFSEEFNYNLALNEVSFNELGEKSKFEYCCNPPILNKFKMEVREWLHSHGVPFNLLLCSDNIHVGCYNEFSNQLINEFEKDFEVKCIRYKISCQFHEINYYFH